MLDAAYVASMMEEEGRRVGFTLAYLSPARSPTTGAPGLPIPNAAAVEAEPPG
jgi:hypothetical protein